MAKKSKRKVSGMAFNALGVVFILGILPLMVAFVSSASGMGSGESESIMPSTTLPSMATGEPYFEWVNNGENVSAWYFTNHPPATPSTPTLAKYNCLYIRDSICQAEGATLYPNTASQSGWLQIPYSAGNVAGFDAYTAPQTHGDTVTSTYAPSSFAYRGGSGNGHFTFKTYGAYYDLDSSKAIDTLSISVLNPDITYSSTSSIFENISFNYKLTLEYDGESIIIDGGNVETDNKLCFDILTSNWASTCAVGMKLNFDLSSFQSHHLQTINNGDYTNTSMTFDFYNFKNSQGNPISGVELPFTGIDRFAFGLEASFVDTQTLNFLVKGGSLLIGVICIGVAVASTPYWDPLKNRLTGVE